MHSGRLLKRDVNSSQKNIYGRLLGKFKLDDGEGKGRAGETPPEIF